MKKYILTLIVTFVLLWPAAGLWHKIRHRLPEIMAKRGINPPLAAALQLAQGVVILLTLSVAYGSKKSV